MLDAFFGLAAQHGNSAAVIAPQPLNLRARRFDHRAASSDHLADTPTHTGFQIDDTRHFLQKDASVIDLRDNAFHRREQPPSTRGIFPGKHLGFIDDITDANQ